MAKKTKKASRPKGLVPDYYLELFRMPYFFFIGWSEERLAKHMAVNFGYQLDASHSSGKCILLDGPQGHAICIWTHAKDKSPSTLAHECIHAAMMTLSLRGVDARGDDGETLAYLVGHLMEVALEGK